MRRRRFLTWTLAAAALAGCAGDGGTTEPTDGTGTTGTGDGTTEAGPPELPGGLAAEGVDLSTLRAAVDEVVESGSFRGIGGMDVFGEGDDVRSDGRSVSGIGELGRGRELEATGGVTLYEKVDDEDITPESATLDALLQGRVRDWYVEDGRLYVGPDPVDSEESNYDDYLARVSGYADEVFDILETLEYGEPEWDPDRRVFEVPITGFRDEASDGGEIEVGSLHVTPEGLPVAAGGRSVGDDGTSYEQLVVLRTEGVEVERPDWVDEADAG